MWPHHLYLWKGTKGKANTLEVKNCVKEVSGLPIHLKRVLDIYDPPGKNSVGLEV